MRVLDLFSGIGGFSLGLERAGMRTVAFCEIDPYCQAVLRKHWDAKRRAEIASLRSALEVATATGDLDEQRNRYKTALERIAAPITDRGPEGAALLRQHVAREALRQIGSATVVRPARPLGGGGQSGGREW